MRIRKVILPVAGLGKRLRPLTLNCPKALVPVSGKPLLDYILEEVVGSEIDEATLVINSQHRKIFKEYIKSRHRMFPALSFHLRVQREAFGNGHAILQAQDVVGNEPFAVRFCDDLLFDKKHGLAHLLGHFEDLRAPVFMLERIPWEDIARYGVVAVRDSSRSPIYEVARVVEKPKVMDYQGEHSLSNLAVVGAYVLTPRILEHLREGLGIAPPLSDALPLTVAFHSELMVGGRIYGFEFPGVRHDCGNLEGLRTAEKFLASRK